MIGKFHIFSVFISQFHLLVEPVGNKSRESGVSDDIDKYGSPLHCTRVPYVHAGVSALSINCTPGVA